MNFYITSGTPDFMEKLIAKNHKESLILLHGNGNSVVLHESPKKSFFAVPRNFEVLDQKGQFEQKGYFTFYNMPILSDGRPVFENAVSDVITSLKTDSTVIAYRFLRPIKADTYLLIIQWVGPASFDVWKNGQNYKAKIAPILEGKASVIQSMFDTSFYMTTYSATPKD
ncbi:Target of RNAIII-activating protein [Solibacillus sp. R5-41]|uniref:Target of RNAIII-activating protein n=1 Tax=Solibacillus sp. R5-41 TaxID=2048654 RepID=UPI000C124DFF|nr:Target of RNAIII-activating protein [Solibacillus sp. R5-41]ATP41770.1 Target of RNAIII-activating protein [Solibacillus sp. R5-41]